MKGLVILFVIGVLAAIGSVFVLKEAASDDSRPIAMGFDAPGNGEIEMNLVVNMVHVKQDPPRQDPNSNKVYWNEWVDEHFKIYDSRRQAVELSRVGSTTLIPPDKLGAGVEFFLKGMLKPGEEYQLDLTPIPSEGKIYRCTFTAPNKKDTMRPNLDLVD
ncbi:MAG TPA: hypothetical protein VNT79_13475 [Phycisphaerae bacterium]|nr:hypothetical protein [Phycisphaerae bacterium]